MQSQRPYRRQSALLFNVSRTNLRGTDQSITLRTNYGTLEQIALLSYQDPHVFNKPSLNLTLSGGYNNSAVISTYQASILSGALRVSQRVTKPTTLIYSFSYRRVSVNAATLQVSLSEIPLLAQPVRVGGPGITYIRDTRDVPLDAHHGTFNTGEVFFADGNIRLASQLRPDRPQQCHLLRLWPGSLGVCAADPVWPGAFLRRRG